MHFFCISIFAKALIEIDIKVTAVRSNYCIFYAGQLYALTKKIRLSFGETFSFFQMAHPLLFDGTWLQQNKYEAAEAFYQRVLAGTNSEAVSKQGLLTLYLICQF